MPAPFRGRHEYIENFYKIYSLTRVEYLELVGAGFLLLNLFYEVITHMHQVFR